MGEDKAKYNKAMIPASNALRDIASELFDNRAEQEKLKFREKEIHAKLVETIIREKAYDLISINYRLLRSLL